jgi:hypothetical protein
MEKESDTLETTSQQGFPYLSGSHINTRFNTTVFTTRNRNQLRRFSETWEESKVEAIAKLTRINKS